MATVSAGNQRAIGRLDQSFHALVLGDHNALFPLLTALRRRLARRVANNDAVETVGMFFGKAERGRSAHRQAGEMRFLDRKGIEKAERIGEKRVERIAAGRRLGSAVAALVVAQHPELVLAVPRPARPTSPIVVASEFENTRHGALSGPST